MSLQKIEYILQHLDDKEEWSVQLLRIKNPRNSSTVYAARDIALYPEGALLEFVKAVKKYYLEGSNAKIRQYEDVHQYDGTAMSTIIYKLPSNHELIAHEYLGLNDCLAESQTDGNPFDFAANAFVLSGIIYLPQQYCDDIHSEGYDASVRLICLQNPVSVLKHKFLYDEGTFREIKDKVLSIRPFFDVLIIEDSVYMLTLAGEKLFNMERSYKAICSDKVFEIEHKGIINDPGTFSNVAHSGQNPRKFTAFRDDYFARLVEYPEDRLRISQRYGIPMSGDQFDTTTEDGSRKLIKFVCGKGMRDAFEDIPVEVDGTRPWK